MYACMYVHMAKILSSQMGLMNFEMSNSTCENETTFVNVLSIEI